MVDKIVERQMFPYIAGVFYGLPWSSGTGQGPVLVATYGGGLPYQATAQCPSDEPISQPRTS